MADLPKIDPKVEEKIPKTKEDFEEPDDNPNSFINEALWKKVLFKVLGYFVYVVGISIMIDEMSNIMFNWVKFTTGVTAIILPVIWGALDAQARNREIQEKIQNEKAIEKSRQEAITASTEAEKQIADSRAKLMEKQQEIYRLKALLIAKTENVNALDEACKAADALKGGEIDLL